MSQVSEVQHRAHARQWVDTQNRAHAALKKGRNATLSSVKEKLVEETIHKIEHEIAEKGLSVPRSTFTGFPRPWKKRG